MKAAFTLFLWEIATAKMSMTNARRLIHIRISDKYANAILENDLAG